MQYLQILLMLLKLLSIPICGYYILKANEYTILWNLMVAILPTKWITFINIHLSTIETLILIVLMSIIVCSLLYKESKLINTLANFFGVMGITFVLIQGLRNGILNKLSLGVGMVSYINSPSGQLQVGSYFSLATCFVFLGLLLIFFIPIYQYSLWQDKAIFSFFGYLTLVILIYIAIVSNSVILLFISCIYLTSLLIYFPILPIEKSFYHFILLSIGTIILFFPKFLSIIFLILFILSIIVSVPTLDMVIPRAKWISFCLLKLHDQKLLAPFLRIYVYYFSQPTNSFKCSALSLYLVCFSYQLFFRNKIFFLSHSLNTPSFLSFLYFFLSVLLLYVYFSRTIINLSSILYSLTSQNQPKLINEACLFMVDNEDSPQPSQEEIRGKTESLSQSRNYSFFHRSFSRNYYHVITDNPRFFRYFGLFGGLAVGAFTVFEMKKQTVEMQRQNDLEEVSQGIRTKEWYQAKYNVPPATSSKSDA